MSTVTVSAGNSPYTVSSGSDTNDVVVSGGAMFVDERLHLQLRSVPVAAKPSTPAAPTWARRSAAGRRSISAWRRHDFQWWHANSGFRRERQRHDDLGRRGAMGWKLRRRLGDGDQHHDLERRHAVRRRGHRAAVRQPAPRSSAAGRRLLEQMAVGRRPTPPFRTAGRRTSE